MKNDLLGSIMSGMKIPQSETSEWEGQPRMTDDKKGVAMVGESTMRSVDSSDNSCSGADKKKAISKKRRLEELISDEELCKKTSGGRGRIENLKKKPADGSDNSHSGADKKKTISKTSGGRGRIENLKKPVDGSDNSHRGADKKKTISKKRRVEELFSDEELCKKTSGRRGRIENLKKKPADGSDKTISKKRRVEELLSDEELCKKTSGRRGRIENLKKSADSSGNSRYCPLVALKEMVRKRRRKELFDDEE